MTDLPFDWEFPDWNNCGKVHDWKNHVSNGVRQIWYAFDGYQKKELAIQANEQAGNEEWD